MPKLLQLLVQVHFEIIEILNEKNKSLEESVEKKAENEKRLDADKEYYKNKWSLLQVLFLNL